MCIILCNFIPYRDSWNHDDTQNTEVFHHHKGTPCYPFIFPPRLYTLAKANNMASLYSFVISRMSHIWNHTGCNLVRLTYFAKRNVLDIHAGCCMYQCIDRTEFI